MWLQLWGKLVEALERNGKKLGMEKLVICCYNNHSRWNMFSLQKENPGFSIEEQLFSSFNYYVPLHCNAPFDESQTSVCLLEQAQHLSLLSC